MTTRRMWNGGPLRQWSDRPMTGKSIRYEHGDTVGYAGAYVCEKCKETVAGVYRVHPTLKWFCGPCRERLPSKGKRKCRSH
jgi:hypothetical protein